MGKVIWKGIYVVINTIAHVLWVTIDAVSAILFLALLMFVLVKFFVIPDNITLVMVTIVILIFWELSNTVCVFFLSGSNFSLWQRVAFSIAVMMGLNAIIIAFLTWVGVGCSNFTFSISVLAMVSILGMFPSVAGKPHLLFKLTPFSQLVWRNLTLSYLRDNKTLAPIQDIAMQVCRGDMALVSRTLAEACTHFSKIDRHIELWAEKAIIYKKYEVMFLSFPGPIQEDTNVFDPDPFKKETNYYDKIHFLLNFSSRLLEAYLPFFNEVWIKNMHTLLAELKTATTNIQTKKN